MTAILWGWLGVTASVLQGGLLTLLILRGRGRPRLPGEFGYVILIYGVGWALPSALTGGLWWLWFRAAP
jgi:hypothetical protein